MNAYKLCTTRWNWQECQWCTPKYMCQSINQLLWQWEINNIDYGPKRSAQTGFFLLLYSCTYMHLKSFFVLVILPVCLCGCEGGWGQWMTNWLGFCTTAEAVSTACCHVYVVPLHVAHSPNWILQTQMCCLLAVCRHAGVFHEDTLDVKMIDKVTVIWVIMSPVTHAYTYVRNMYSI